MPKALVALTVYNDAEYLAEAMQSIVDQSFRDFTFLVVDDGSTDASPEIIAQFCKQDARVQCITLPQNQGRPTARNVALEAAFKAHKEQGVDYLFWMDGDDISLPQRLERQVGYMDVSPKISAQGTALQCFHESTHDIKAALAHDVLKAQAIWVCPIVSATACLRLKDFYRHRLYFDATLLRAEDYAFWLDMLFTTPMRISNTAEILYKYRYFHRPTSIEYHALASQRLLQALALPHDLESAQKHTIFAYSTYGSLPTFAAEDILLWANTVYETIVAQNTIALKSFLRITTYKVERFLELFPEPNRREALIKLLLSLPLGRALYVTKS